MSFLIYSQPVEPVHPGFVGKIPVKNLWLLMLYASELYRAGGSKYAGIEDNPEDIPELVAKILTHSVEKRLKQNLSVAYEARHRIINRVRGKIDLLTTERHQLVMRGKVACDFDELTQDTPRNRYIKRACRQLAKITKPQTSRRLMSLSKSFERLGVSNEPFPEHLATSPLARHERNDTEMLFAAKLAHKITLPNEADGLTLLPIVDRDIHWLRLLFEKSMTGFFDVNLSGMGWKVFGGQTIHWPVYDASEGVSALLPRMQTDIVLENKQPLKRIVIDTKFTSVLRKNHHGQDRFKRDYLFQLYSYLRSQEREQDILSFDSDGLFLHPSVGEDIDEQFSVQGHSIRFLTVDLSKTAKEIKQSLMTVVADYAPSQMM